MPLKNFIIALLAVVFMSAGFAKSGSSYGPVKSGETLWDVATEVRPNKSVSVGQLVFAIYKLNPKAFYSNNMNLLQAGAILNIPDNDAVLKTTNNEAIKRLNQHVHALDILRADAKHLKIARDKSKKYKSRVKKIQAHLGKFRYESGDWNSTYLKLVSAKRKLARSKRRVVKLRRLILEKATLKPTRIAKEIAEKETTRELEEENIKSKISEVNTRLTGIQASLESLNNSNINLVNQVEDLSTLSQRIEVLEQELGKHDELVIQLKNTLEVTQQAIQQQSQKSDELRLRLDELEESESEQIKTGSIEKDKAENVEAVEDIPEKTELETVAEITSPDKTESVSISGDISDDPAEAHGKEDNSATLISEEPSNILEESSNIADLSVEDNSENEQQNIAEASDIQEQSKQNIDKVLSVPDSIDLAPSQIESAENGKTIVEHEVAKNENLSEEIDPSQSTQVEANLQDGFDSYADYFVDSNPNTNTKEQALSHDPASAMHANFIAPGASNLSNPDKLRNHQRKRNENTLAYSTSDYWIKLAKDKIIIIGGVLNGIILLFVFFKLFSNKKVSSKEDDVDSKVREYTTFQN